MLHVGTLQGSKHQNLQALLCFIQTMMQLVKILQENKYLKLCLSHRMEVTRVPFGFIKNPGFMFEKKEQ